MDQINRRWRCRLLAATAIGNHHPLSVPWGLV